MLSSKTSEPFDSKSMVGLAKQKKLSMTLPKTTNIACSQRNIHILSAGVSLGKFSKITLTHPIRSSA